MQILTKFLCVPPSHTQRVYALHRELRKINSSSNLVVNDLC